MEELLIERLQNYTLDRKILSIDSVDRDINKWPRANNFEITTPVLYNNIESIKLLNIKIPNKLDNISETLQNNKLFILKNDQKHLITLENGFYNNQELAMCLQNNIKNFITDISVNFNTLNKKMYFNSNENFSFIFKDNDLSYNITCNNNYNDIFKQHSDWGLGFILGFDKNSIASEVIDKLNFNHNNIIITNNTNQLIKSTKKVNLSYYEFLYLEIDRFNTSDEIIPYINNHNTNINTGKPNAFFAKIPNVFNNFDNGFINLDNIHSFSYYQPPIEKISKLKFKLRYHNGMLVDLDNYNVSFTLEINQIRNEIKNYNIRTPFKL
tara:strand:- start:8140 stop:9114 length:975 start_codon:yes stop_codon:yes gene_type:complete